MKRAFFTAATSLILCLAFFHGRAEATTVAEVCATGGNLCGGGAASINVLTTVSCPSTLDFAAAGLGNVTINSGGSLTAEKTSLCELNITVNTLHVKNGGKIESPGGGAGTKPGKISVVALASGDAIKVDANGAIAVYGGAGTPPTISLFASVGNVVINGTVVASATTTGARGGVIKIVAAQGKVTIDGSAIVRATAKDPGGTFISIDACLDLIVTGTLNASAHTNGAEIRLFTRSNLVVTGDVLANLGMTGGVEPSITMEARGNVTFDAALITANTSGTNATGGAISVLSANGTLTCNDSTFQAYAHAGGAKGGSISLRSKLDLEYDACTLHADGNSFNGAGGTILLQSFREDVFGDNSTEGDASGKTGGAITLKACANPVTDGGVFNPPAVKVGGICVDPPTIPACACP